MRVLLTGAAGFIAGAVGSVLSARGHDVVSVDAMIPQAHPADMDAPPEVRRVDVRDARALTDVMRGVDVVCHQAAMVGAGVTPADLPLYAGHNDLGTAVLLASMAEHGVSRLVLASSMVVYGDGRYACAEHGAQPATPRRLADLEAGRFDVACPVCGAAMGCELVDESAALLPRSSYAASKVAQEHYAAAWSRQLPGAVVALRYHNVYGPGMPRDTPYSGVAALFRSALEAGSAPRVFEDGGQMRDFVHVTDVATANALAVDQVAAAPRDSFTAYNVCSGQPVSILEVAVRVAEGREQADGAGRGGGLEPVTTGEFRSGDVRHVVADPERARAELGFVAETSPDEGLRAFALAPLRATSR
ncbi:MAG: NAD-dependent epimerase/dehydratase family protein [Nocardioidaceae bacterium]